VITLKTWIYLALACSAAGTLAGTDSWVPIGPAPINGFSSGGASGRAGPIAVNPENGAQVWIGTAQGGVWYTPNAGIDWYPMSDKEASLAIGAIVLADCDAAGCSTIYAGTGENAIRRDTFHGVGLLVGTLTDVGPPPQVSWTLIDGGPSATGGSPISFRGGSINDLIHEPGTTGSNTVLYLTLSSGVTASPSEATVTAPEPSSGYGVYKTSNNGATWTKLTIDGSAGAKPTDLEMDPDNSNVLYAGFDGRGIFKKTATGWCPLNPGISAPTCLATTGLPDIGEVVFDHVEIEIADIEEGPNLIYATFGHCPKPLLDSCEPSIYRTTTSDAAWEPRRFPTPNHDQLGCISSYTRYTHALTVHPFSEHVLFAGGVRLCRSQDGGQTFVLSDKNLIADQSHFEGMVHYDHHEIMHDPFNATRLYATNDAGFAVSNDSGFNWKPENHGLQITGMHSVATAPGTPVALGGAQDNGCMIWSGSKVWESTRSCADGGSTLIDVEDPKYMFAATNALWSIGWLTRTSGGGWAVGDPGDNDPRSFYPPLVQDPNSTFYPLYFGTNRLWKSSNKGGFWQELLTMPLSTDTQTEINAGVDVITAIGVAPTDGNRVYVGYYGGGLFHEDYPTNQGTWLDRSAGLPDAPITGIAVHPADRDTVWVSLSGFGHDHVWKTTDGGLIWNAEVAGLPNVPANTIVFEQTPPHDLWLGLDGNDNGDTIYKLAEGSSTWSSFSQGLPNAPVFQISIDDVRNRVFAATHGRGVFLLGNPAAFTSIAYASNDLVDLSVYGVNLPADEDCTLEVRGSDGTPCASGSVDAMGATLRTDGKGVLVGSKAGFFQDRPLIWACHEGTCLGGVAASECHSAASPVSEIVVNCGADSGTAAIFGPQTGIDPPSTRLTLGITSGGAGAGGGGGFDLIPVIQTPDGSTASLCAVDVPMAPGDDADTALQIAADAIDASATCAAAGVSADLIMARNDGSEDVYPLVSGVTLAASGVTGAELVPAIHVPPGGAVDTCFALAESGDPVHGQSQILTLELGTLPAGTAGGSITVAELSGLGTCTITIPTTPGQTADEVALAIESAFQAPGDPGPHADCLARNNPRDLTAASSTLRVVHASQLTVCVSDPGIGWLLAPVALSDVHPVARAGADTTIECTGPAGATVALDGSLSSDADSTPGTNDDIVSFDWFTDYGLATETLLGSGPLLNPTLPLGVHAITLRVTDNAGAVDTRVVTRTVADTVAPSLSVTPSMSPLWPPNHRMVDIVVTPVASDLCSAPVVTLASIASDETDDAPGDSDGETIGDVQDAGVGTTDFDFRLRAERDRNGAGRIYTLDYLAQDSSGNGTNDDTTVTVPLEQNGNDEPLTILVGPGGAGTVVSWGAVPGASAYDVVRGDLGAIQVAGSTLDLGAVICVEASSPDLDTMGDEDPGIPAPGQVWFYLVQYDGTGYGTESAPRPRQPASGDCGAGS
jgi:hypothetical protein